MVELYEYRNHIMLCGDYSEPEPHKHAAAHLILSENEMHIGVGEKVYFTRGIVIPSGEVHTSYNNGGTVLVFVFDQTTSAAQHIKVTNTLPASTVNNLLQKFKLYKENGHKTSEYIDFIHEVYCELDIDESKREINDERIEAALFYIDKRIGDKITCKEVADAVFMSESRFSHLFKKLVGITFAGYLQLRQLSYAYYNIVNGMSVTEAALAAGFSSSCKVNSAIKK